MHVNGPQPIWRQIAWRKIAPVSTAVLMVADCATPRLGRAEEVDAGLDAEDVDVHVRRYVAVTDFAAEIQPGKLASKSPVGDDVTRMPPLQIVHSSPAFRNGIPSYPSSSNIGSILVDRTGSPIARQIRNPLALPSLVMMIPTLEIST